MKRILLVDDDRDFVKGFEEYFSLNFEVICSHSEEGFYQNFNPYSFDVVILDIKLKEKSEGLDILKYIKTENPFLPVIMITGYGSTDFYAEALSLEADAYLDKRKFDFPAVKRVIDTILDKSSLEKKVSNLEKQMQILEPHTMIGESEKIQEVREKIKMAAADGKMTVLIRGETGVGKELVARNIHRLGVRSKGPFVTVMIAGIPRDVLYPELFGHEKGAYTGAYEKRRGFLEEAHKGIIFLDEIGELDMESQVKLLRVIEYQTFSRLGSNKEIKVDLQFVAATNQDLEQLVEENCFRKDLFYRLKAFEIVVPPIRERKEDIPILADYFLSLMKKTGRSTADSISSEIMDYFMSYDWPGNIRELRNIIECLCTITKYKKRNVIDSEFVPNLGGIVTKNTDIKAEPEPQILDYKKTLALSELQLIEEGIKKFGKKKTELSKKLGYNDRFSFLRRVKNAFEKFPEFKDDFPEVFNLFCS